MSRRADWTEANQRFLVAAVAAVRARLERYCEGRRSRDDGDADPLAAARAAMPAPPALDVVGTTFGLSAFERDCLVLAAATDLDGGFADLCAAAQRDASATAPTFGLALAALDGAHWSAITPAGPLRWWRLVEVGDGRGVTASPLRIDERLLHHLTGIEHLDERIETVFEPLDVADELPGSHLALADLVVRSWSAAGPAPGAPRSLSVQLCGPDPDGSRAVGAAACRQLGLRPFSLAADAIPTAAADVDAFSRLWERDARLSGLAAVVDCQGVDHLDGQALRAAARFVRRSGTAAVVVAREPLALGLASPRIDVERPTAAEQHRAWNVALGPRGASLDGAVDRLVAQFDLGPGQIRVVVGGLAAGDVDERGLWDACRAQARPRLDDLAQRIEPVAAWDDLVLPEAQRHTLREMAVHVRQRTTVYDTWGFGAKGRRGLGISALFAGASGTGKTMAAEVLAGELRLDLYRIDLSAVVSKYIGETEKNLRRVFDAAEGGGAILLFDEADALFGKRSEVRDSHDRYANIEVSYLLQRMEAYRGLAILTTNLKSALDPAFLRRIRFVVQFPFPDPGQREEIWHRIFPAETPTGALDLATLARLNLAGGSIRNIAVGAAFLAADAGEPVGMSHLLGAARSEYAKLEKPLTQAEIAGWATS